ncbi:hypothetical protein D9611_014378 [Ephemerocybe angulata]|uniref:Uncharacterized protein n=1 Tax=Ephemerocybe angulata TaxID=980116 RepID=A0A8H5BS48_9AGAR|nr:hypothetical protein D9611_014378 [Tulosesus angulatus]
MADSHLKALLERAGQGNTEDLTKLICRFWPQDISFKCRALFLFLRYLETSSQSEFVRSSSGHVDRNREKHILKASLHIEGSLIAIDAVFRDLTGVSREGMEQLFVILRPNLKMYFSWIKLAARHPFSPVLNPGGSSPLTIRRSLAVRVSVLFESGIHRRLIGDNQLGGEHDDLERDCYEQLVDASLFVWLNAAGLRRERGTLFSPEWYIENVASNWLPMQQCVTHASMAVLMVDKLNTLDSKSLGLLSSSLQRQCLEWPMSFRKRYSEDPNAVDGSSFYSFVEVHHTVFMRAKKFAEISKSNSFPALALRGVGREFSDAPLSLPDGRRSTLGAHITAYYLSTIAFNAPDGALRLLSDLLHAGLLNFLLDTLARLPTGEEPFKSWQWKKRDPLERLFLTSHDLHISMALEAAKDEVPTSTLDAIAANPAAAQAWTMFNESIRPYQEALRRLPTSGRNVPLCDSFEIAKHPALALQINSTLLRRKRPASIIGESVLGAAQSFTVQNAASDRIGKHFTEGNVLTVGIVKLSKSYKTVLYLIGRGTSSFYT